MRVGGSFYQTTCEAAFCSSEFLTVFSTGTGFVNGINSQASLS